MCFVILAVEIGLSTRAQVAVVGIGVVVRGFEEERELCSAGAGVGRGWRGHG
jgi:hypothetical protein